MKVSTNELMLALRAPNSAWLAALICALDEALQDADFGEPQRAMVRALLDSGRVPGLVASAAHIRLAHFEQSIIDDILATAPEDSAPPPKPRPKLTLCGGAA